MVRHILNNSLKYGVGSTVHIKMSLSHNIIVAKIGNNGIGVPQERETKSVLSFLLSSYKTIGTKRMEVALAYLYVEK